MGFVHRHDARAVEGVQEKLAVYRDLLGALLRYDLAVVRIGVVHQLRIDLDARDGEAYLALLYHYRHVALRRKRTLELRHRLRWKYNVLLSSLRKLKFAFNKREATSVGRNHRELLVLEAHEHALKRAASVVLRRRVRSLPEHLPYRRLGYGVYIRLAVLGNRRKFGAGHSLQPEARAARLDRRPLLGVAFDRYLTFGRLRNRSEKELHWKRCNSLFRNLALYFGLYRYVEVGGGELDGISPSLYHHVLQNGKRSLSRHDVLHALETFNEL